MLILIIATVLSSVLGFGNLDDGFKVTDVEKNELRNLLHKLAITRDGEANDYYHFDESYDFYVG